MNTLNRKAIGGLLILVLVLAALLFADFAPLWALILIRVVQGAAGGAYVPALMAALTDLSERAEARLRAGDENRTRAINQGQPRILGAGLRGDEDDDDGQSGALVPAG